MSKGIYTQCRNCGRSYDEADWDSYMECPFCGATENLYMTHKDLCVGFVKKRGKPWKAVKAIVKAMKNWSGL